MRRRRETPEAWLTLPERAALLVLRSCAALVLALGRRATLLLLRPLVLFAALVLGERRRASRRWLRRVGSRAGGFRAVHRHLLRLAQLRVDDVLLLAGRGDALEVVRRGGALPERQGALLVGAHLGSLGALRVLADERGRRLHALLDAPRARLWNALLRRLDPSQPVRLIEVGPGALSGPLQVRALIEQGEWVALLGDRARDDEPVVEVPFLGGVAALPTAPFAMAAALRCPAHLVLALHREPAGYELLVEPLLEPGALPPPPRDAALAAAARRLAARLEHHARRAPDDWFNLYPGWGRRRPTSHRLAARAGAR